MPIDEITEEVVPLLPIVASGQPQYYVDIAARNNTLVSVTFQSINTVIDQFNTSIGQMNQVSVEVNNNATLAEQSAANSSASANYQGDWSLTPTLPVVYPYPLGISVSHGGSRWASKVDNNSEEPIAESANWALLPESGITDTMISDLNGSGYSIVGTAIKTATALTMNVSTHDQLIATLTVDASITFTGYVIGSSDWICEFTASGFTPTWDANVTWDGDGTEPTWSAGTDTIYFKTTDGGTTVTAMRVRAGA